MIPALGTLPRRVWAGYLWLPAAATLLWLITLIPWDFGFATDYSIFNYANHKCCMGWPETRGMFEIGRPLAGIVISIYMMFPSSIADFATLRFFNGALLIGLSYWCYVIFAGLSERHRFLALIYACLIFTLPFAVLWIIWLSSTGIGLINVGLTAAAFTLVNKAYAKMGATRALLAAAGYIILLTTFYLYPVTSYFFLVFTCWRMLTTSEKTVYRDAARSLSELVAVGILSIVFLISVDLLAPRLTMLLYGTYQAPIGAYSFSLVADPIVRLKKFLFYVEYAFRMWLFDVPNVLPVLTSLLAIVAIVVRLRKATRHQIMRAAMRALIVAMVMIMTAAPVVAAAGGFIALRTVFVTSAIAVAVLLFAVKGAVEKLGGNALVKLCLGLLLLVGVCSAILRATTYAAQATAEVNFLRHALAGVPDDQTIVIEDAPGSDRIFDFQLPADFGPLAFNTPQPADTQFGLVRAVLRELGLPFADRKIIPLGSLRYTADLSGDPGQYRVDMAGAGYRWANVRSRSKDWATVRVSPLSYGSSGVNALIDLGAVSFWESIAGFPVHYSIEFLNICRTIKSYSLAAPYAEPQRMPLEWDVRTSNGDAEPATVIDKQNAQVGWQSLERRTFSVSPEAGCAKKIDFTFYRTGQPPILRIGNIEIDATPSVARVFSLETEE